MSDEAQRFSIVFQPSGLRCDALSTATVLQSVRDAGLVMASSCRNGTCRTCICRLLRGRVRYRIEWPGLSAEEKAEGFILPCVALPESALVIEAHASVIQAGITQTIAPPPAPPAAA